MEIPSSLSITENVIVTPFLPPRVFMPRLEASQTVQAGPCLFTLSKDITVLRSGIGAGAVAGAVALLVGTPCRNAFFIGSCAGIPGSTIGALVAAKSARQNDGAVFSPAPDLLDALTAYLCRRAVPFTGGTLLTVDAPCIDRGAVPAVGEGSFYIDMETAVFYAATAAAGLRAAALLYVTDIPSEKPFTGRHSEEDRQAIVRARDTVIAAVTGFLKRS